MTRALLLLSLAACGPVADAPPTRATVRFEYRAATETDPGIAALHPACINLVGDTHLHPGWRDFARVLLRAEGSELWTVTLDDVPTRFRQSIRVSDPNACEDNPTGAVTALAVFANDTLLTRPVDTPGTGGVEPGFSFVVDALGVVSP